MTKRKILKCVVCGCEADLPRDRSIKETGFLAMPLHRRLTRDVRDFEPVETNKDPDSCPGGELLGFIEFRGVPRFKFGDLVIISSIHPADGVTSHEIVGHAGQIEEVEPLFNGDFNYFMKCKTCTGSHYMHEVELLKLDS